MASAEHLLPVAGAGPVGCGPGCTCCSSRSPARWGADGAAGVFCCGLRVVSVDGSSTDVPDTEDNAAYFGRPCNATRDGAFPQVVCPEREGELDVGERSGAMLLGR